MAKRFGGAHSPRPQGPAPRPSAAPRGTVPMRANALYLAPLPLLWTAFRQDAIGMATDFAAAGILASAVFTLNEGLKAEAAYAARSVARRPALPRKILAAVLAGLGVTLAAFAPPDGPMVEPLVYGVIAVALHLVAFGLDPLRDKGMEGSDSFQHERAARAVQAAEAHLAAMGAAIGRAGDRALEDRVARFQATVREMIARVEEDPRDLTAARKYLGVYLEGARDATIKFADLYARTPDETARSDYARLLDDLETNFAARRERLMESDRTDFDVEIEVLRDRLRREGVRTESD